MNRAILQISSLIFSRTGQLYPQPLTEASKFSFRHFSGFPFAAFQFFVAIFQTFDKVIRCFSCDAHAFKQLNSVNVFFAHVVSIKLANYLPSFIVFIFTMTVLSKLIHYFAHCCHKLNRLSCSSMARWFSQIFSCHTFSTIAFYCDFRA